VTEGGTEGGDWGALKRPAAGRAAKSPSSRLASPPLAVAAFLCVSLLAPSSVSECLACTSYSLQPLFQRIWDNNNIASDIEVFNQHSASAC
jgi:hypothetical protein